MSDLLDDALKGTLTVRNLRLYLRDSNCNVDRPGGPKDVTPLAAACWKGHLNVVNLLLDVGLADPNALSSHRRTPLFYATTWSPDRDRAAIVRALLSAGATVDVRFPKDGNNTPLLQAIFHTGDQDVVHELVDHGASVQLKNDDGETAETLRMTNTMDFRKREERAQSSGEMFKSIVALVLQIVFLVNKLVGNVVKNEFNFSGAKNDNPANVVNASASLNPVTVADFEASIKNYVTNETNLEDFYGSDNPFFTRLATRAAALRDDPGTTADDVRRLTVLALYQPVIYGDDSSSMQSQGGASWNKQRELIVRIARIATKIIPDELLVELRFINSSSSLKLSAMDVGNAIDSVKPNGSTRIGTHLYDKILQPLVYNVLATGQRLKRPLLICTITDGCPTEEDTHHLKRVISDCKIHLQKYGYDSNAVKYSISQIGDDSDAKAFLDGLQNDASIKDVLYCTTDRLDHQYKHLRENEKGMEKWLLQLLTEPIMIQRQKN